MEDYTLSRQDQQELTIHQRIEAERERIEDLFINVEPKQRDLVKNLIQNAAFMKATLEDLQEIIAREGVVETYQNGANQKGLKPSSTLQSYNSLIKNYTTVIQKLSGLLPKPVEPTGKDNAELLFLKEVYELELELERDKQRDKEQAGA